MNLNLAETSSFNETLFGFDEQPTPVVNAYWGFPIPDDYDDDEPDNEEEFNGFIPNPDFIDSLPGASNNQKISVEIDITIRVNGRVI